MIEKPEEFRKLLYTVSELLKADSENELKILLDNAEINIEETGYDNWNGGTYFFTIHLNIDVESFVKIRDKIEKIETDLLRRFEIGTRHIESEVISAVRIIPKAQPKIDWQKISELTTKENLIKDIEYLKNTMVSVATGGHSIQDVNNEYKEKYQKVNKALQRLNIQNSNPYKDLWDWYGKWRSDFPHYRERRAYIKELYDSLLQTLSEDEEPEMISVTVDLNGWERIERTIQQIKVQQSNANKEEQFQMVGLLCRETIITLAQTVYNPDKHITLEKITISKTDAKRMLESYISVELSGSSNETLRKYAKATLDLANELTHKRTATKKDSALCSTATLSLINFIGTIEGRI